VRAHARPYMRPAAEAEADHYRRAVETAAGALVQRILGA
jgi:hypothetical protein